MQGRVRVRAMAATAAVAALSAVAALPGTGVAERTPAKAPGKAKVKVVDFSFGPKTVKVAKGGKVVWKFKQGAHNVVGGGFKSAIKSSGRYSHKFGKRGTYDYRCTLHQPNMDGTVKVVR